MTKAELVKHIAAACAAHGQGHITAAVIDTTLAQLADACQGLLAAGDKVHLPGLGTFTAVTRAARQGRNPRTGSPVQIPARQAVHFSAAKALADSLNSD